MRGMHLGPLEAALRKRREYLEAKDPRLNVSISINGNQQQVHLTPKEQVHFKMHFNASSRESLQGKLRDLIDRGVETRFTTREVQISGSPLLEEMLKEAGAQGEVAIKFGNEYPSTVELTLEGDNTPVFVHVDGISRAGAKVLTFEGQWPRSPFTAFFTSELPVNPQNLNLEVRLPINNWAGQHVLALTYFDRVQEAVRALNSGKALTFSLEIQGNRVGKARTTTDGPMFDPAIIETIEWVGKLRRICKHFQLDPLLPEVQKIPAEDWATVEYVSYLLDGKVVRDQVPDVSLSFSVDKVVDRTVLGEGPGLLRIDGRADNFKIIGYPVSVGPLSYTFSEISLLKCEPSGTGGTEVEMAGTAKSERTAQLSHPVKT